MSEPTVGTVTRDDTNTYYDEYGSETLGKIVTELTGEFRRKALEKVGVADGDDVSITITEDYWNSGYCETCSYEELDFQIHVNGEEVHNTRANYVAERSSVFSALNYWLNEKED